MTDAPGVDDCAAAELALAQLGTRSGTCDGLRRHLAECPPCRAVRAELCDVDLAGYSIERELGYGAARVLAARHERTGRRVVIKEPLADEAAILASLAHPGIVPLLGVERAADGRTYLVMPRIRGRTMFEALADAPDARARRGLLAALHDACAAVAHAHRRGIVHRDLTPANIVVTGGERAVVIDWGLAAAAASSGVIAGTPGYCAPEQALGLPVDERADVYALGVILREIVGDAGALAQAGPSGLGRLIARATAFVPGERPRDAAAFARALAALIAPTMTDRPCLPSCSVDEHPHPLPGPRTNRLDPPARARRASRRRMDPPRRDGGHAAGRGARRAQ